MGDVLAFAGHAHAVALDGLGQNHGRLAGMFGCGGVGRINLVRVVATAIQPPDVLVGQVTDHLLQFLVLAEEVLAGIRTALGLEVLILAVHALLHELQQQAFLIGGEQRVPIRAPQYLNDVPTRPPEIAFQFLDDLAVAAHRAVEPLQIAVDDEDQIVQILAGGQGDGAQGLRFVHLAVAAEAPDFATFGIDDAAIVQVLHEPRLVDGLDRAETHRHGGELPEIRHQPGVRVGTEAVAIHFLPEVVELLLVQPPFQISAGVNTGGGVALDEHQIPAVRVAGGVPEVVEADIIEGGAGGEAGDVPAQFGGDAVSLDHHGQRVPADQRTDAPFHAGVAGGVLLLVDRDGVEVGGVGAIGHVDAGGAGLVLQFAQEKMGALQPFRFQYRFEGIKPLLRFLRVQVAVILDRHNEVLW